MSLRAQLLCGPFVASAFFLGSNGMAATVAATAAETAQAPAASVGEVVVTARKREENVQRVPISITVNSGRQLQQQRITEVTDLGKIVPSLRTFVSSSSDNSAQFALRGQVASDTLPGISQPISLYEDTVNIPHPFGANNAFFDISRVEVLHGPQGTLYGRNNTGGTINIITRDADFNGLHGFLEGEYGNFQNGRFGGAVNIPVINDVLAVRFAYQHWDRKGFGRSLVDGQDLGDDHHDNLARLSLRFTPRDNFRINGKVEFTDAHHTGQFLANTSVCGVSNAAEGVVAGAQVCGPQFAGGAPSAGTLRTLAGLAPDTGFVQNALATNPVTGLALLSTALNTGGAAGAAAFNQLLNLGQGALAPCIGFSYTDCVGDREFDNLTTWHGVIDASWDITPWATLRSITGYHSFLDWKNGDLDATQAQILGIGGGNPSSYPGAIQPAPYFGNFVAPYPLKPDQGSRTFTQEFDISGKGLFGHIDWLGGAYIFSDLARGAQESLTNNTLGVATNLIDLAAGRTLGATGVSSPFIAQDHDILAARSNSWSLFTQEDFHVTDWLSITGGLRYTHEHLTEILTNWDYTYFPALVAGTPRPANSYTCEGGNLGAGGIATTIVGLPLPVPGVPDSCAYASGVNGLGQSGSAFGPGGSFQNATFKGLSYLASVNFQITPDVLFYVKTSRGFRGGAYGRTNAPAAQPEIAVDYEAGLKGSFFNHRVRIDIDGYQTNYTNKQVSVLTCNGGGAPPCANGFSTAVVNAASARMRGFEAEGTVIPFEGASISGNLSYLNAIYTKWIGAVSADGNALCTIRPDLSGQFINPATNAVINANQCATAGNPFGVANPSGNAAGIPLGVTPNWQGSIVGRYEHPAGPGVASIQIGFQYVGSVPITPINHFLALPLSVDRFIQRGVGLVDLRLEYNIPEQGLNFAAWVSNLGNAYWGRPGISATFNGGLGHILVNDPRMFGFTIRKTFGAD
jgi:iron complex outermembrane receptor protein